KVIRFDLAGAITAGLEFGNASGVDVETDDPCAEGDSDREPDISKTDDGELATVRHDLPLTKAPMRIGAFLPRAKRHSQWTNSRRLLEQASRERDQVAADTLAREVPLDQFAAGLAELAPQLRIACEPIDGIGKRRGIVERHQQRVEVRPGDIPASGNVGRNQRSAASG